jgi:protease-4
MLRFITRFFAFIGFIVVLLSAGVIAAAIHFSNKPAPEPGNVILTLDFDEPISERGTASALSLALNEDTTSLLDILRAIDKAKTDPRVKGIVAHFGSTQPKLAESDEIRNAIKNFRTSGKFTYAFAPSYGEFGQGNRTYYLASAFENIWLQPVGSVALTGLALQSPFGRTALERIGVKADFMQREEYKSFMDMATRDDFAPPVRANMQSLLDDLARQIAEGIADGRGWSAKHVGDLMARGPFTDEEAVKENLVTRLGYFDELDDELKQKAGTDAKSVNTSTYLTYGPKVKTVPKTKIALIYGTGLIMDHDDDATSVTSEKIMGADTIADAFDAAAEDSEVKGVLFRVDSPGGTPQASETIRRAMIHTQKAGKPVYVSMGDTSASGGYWISMNADRIIAEPVTITGSIGVLAGKFEIGGLLQKLGITMSSIKTSDNAGMTSLTEGWTPLQRERMNALLDSSYRTFTQNVADARHIPMAKIPEIAKGRVWTGAQAQQIGLVDELGGYGVALGALKKKLNLSEADQVEVEIYPPPESPMQRILKLMKTLGMEEAALRPLGIRAPELLGVLQTALQKPILLRTPISATNIK